MCVENHTVKGQCPQRSPARIKFTWIKQESPLGHNPKWVSLEVLGDAASFYPELLAACCLRDWASAAFPNHLPDIVPWAPGMPLSTSCIAWPFKWAFSPPWAEKLILIPLNRSYDEFKFNSSYWIDPIELILWWIQIEFILLSWSYAEFIPLGWSYAEFILLSWSYDEFILLNSSYCIQIEFILLNSSHDEFKFNSSCWIDPIKPVCLCKAQALCKAQKFSVLAPACLDGHKNPISALPGPPRSFQMEALWRMLTQFCSPLQPSPCYINALSEISLRAPWCLVVQLLQPEVVSIAQHMIHVCTV